MKPEMFVKRNQLCQLNHFKFVILGTLFIAGCGKNPLLGSWVSVQDLAYTNKCKTYKFTEDRYYCDSASWPVSYQNETLGVMVVPDTRTALTSNLSYAFHNKDLISYIERFSKQPVYLTRRGTPHVSGITINSMALHHLSELDHACLIERGELFGNAFIPNACAAGELKRKNKQYNRSR